MERIYRLDRLFRRRKPPSKREILEMFEISPAQFKRDLDYMRNRLGAPITFDMEAGGYKYTAEEFNLPGLWFTEREVYSLLLMQSLLDQCSPASYGNSSDRLRTSCVRCWASPDAGPKAFWSGCRSVQGRSARSIPSIFRRSATVRYGARSCGCATTLDRAGLRATEWFRRSA